MIPTIQSIHIIGIATAVGSAFMIAMRVTGWLGADQTLLQTQRRYGPWLTGALWLLLATGALLVLAEPPREFDAVSFWLKMALVALIATLSFAFQRSVRRHDGRWESAIVSQPGLKWAALATFLIWIAIIFLGRFIAYDTVWGHILPGTKA
ncbi:MAG: DUF6644 family protein [Caulobacteraceae bacterium]